MFHGGTNFGFMAGANNVGTPPYILSDITSYGNSYVKLYMYNTYEIQCFTPLTLDLQEIFENVFRL